MSDKNEYNKKLYCFLIDAKDEEGYFFQNFYPYGTSFEDAANKTMRYLLEEGYLEIKLDKYEVIDLDRLPSEEIIQYDDYDGYIQNIKFCYDENVE